jgi:hypothetical protein
MFSRYIRTFLVALLTISALAACGRTAVPQPAPEPTAVSQETAEINEAIEAVEDLQEITENPLGGSSEEIEPFELPLDAALPRSVTYANLEWTVTEATIDNTKISLFQTDKRTDEYHAAHITLEVKNPLIGYMSLDSGLLRLRMGGEMYEPDESRPLDMPRGGEDRESHLVFRVPLDATWQGAALVIAESGKVPAELVLDGPAPEREFPMALGSGATATTQETDYKIMSAVLGLDYRGKRIEEGKRYLALTMRVTFNGQPNLAVTGENFRLLVDGAPMAPIDSIIEVIDPNSFKEGEVVFEIPASVTQAALQVGETAQGETAQIPLDLAAAMASR